MGYTSQQFLPDDNSSNANFRLWAGGISAAILAMGWAHTSDPQPNWTTQVVPSSTFVSEIFKPQDALQTGSSQFFLKIEYGFSTTIPRIRFSIGTGTDGSGNLTGFITNLTTPTTSTANEGNNGLECNFCGDTDRLGIMMFRNGDISATSGNWCLFIERTKNVDGTNSAEGVTIWVFTIANSPGGARQALQQSIVFGVGVAPALQQVNQPFYVRITDTQEAVSSAFNNGCVLQPTMPYIGRYGAEQTVVAFCHFTDAMEGIKFSTTQFGVTRTFIAAAAAYMLPANVKLCMRFD